MPCPILNLERSCPPARTAAADGGRLPTPTPPSMRFPVPLSLPPPLPDRGCPRCNAAVVAGSSPSEQTLHRLVRQAGSAPRGRCGRRFIYHKSRSTIPRCCMTQGGDYARVITAVGVAGRKAVRHATGPKSTDMPAGARRPKTQIAPGAQSMPQAQKSQTKWSDKANRLIY